MDSYDDLLTGVLASSSVPYNPFSTQQLQHIPSPHPYCLKPFSLNVMLLHGKPGMDQGRPLSLHSPSLLLCLPFYSWHSPSPLPTTDFAGILNVRFPRTSLAAEPNASPTQPSWPSNRLALHPGSFLRSTYHSLKRSFPFIFNVCIVCVSHYKHDLSHARHLICLTTKP